MNLGAGAETGIYQVKDGEIDEYGNYIMENGEYLYLYAEVNRECSVDTIRIDLNTLLIYSKTFNWPKVKDSINFRGS
jgi:hypothetical protein